MQSLFTQDIGIFLDTASIFVIIDSTAHEELQWLCTDDDLIRQLNAGMQHVMLWFTSSTLYVNPYLVVTPQGYTKHYYIGSQRIAAQTGYTAFLPNAIVSENNSSEHVQLAQNLLQTQMEMYESSETQEPDEIPYLDIDGQDASELQPLCTDDMQVVEVGYSMTSNRIYSLLSHNYWPDANSDPEIYYYHSDHLGIATE